MSIIVDYTENFAKHLGIDVLVAQGKGDSFIAIIELDTPHKRFDGKKGKYLIEHKWLSVECEHSDDEAWACVMGDDVTIWTKAELKNLLRDLKNGDVDVFEHFLLL